MIGTTDRIAVISADQDSNHGLHFMRLTGDEAQTEKSFKFVQPHSFHAISSSNGKITIFGKQHDTVERGYIYQMCQNDAQNSNTFSRIGTSFEKVTCIWGVTQKKPIFNLVTAVKAPIYIHYKSRQKARIKFECEHENIVYRNLVDAVKHEQITLALFKARGIVLWFRVGGSEMTSRSVIIDGYSKYHSRAAISA